jgi:hypothetical protein
VGAPADGGRRGGVGGHGRRLDLRRRAQARRSVLLLLAPARLHGHLPSGSRRAAPDLAAARGRRRVRQGAHRLRRRLPPGTPRPGVCTCYTRRRRRRRRGGAAGADLVANQPAGGGGEGWRGRAAVRCCGVRRRRGARFERDGVGVTRTGPPRCLGGSDRRAYGAAAARYLRQKLSMSCPLVRLWSGVQYRGIQ